MANSTHVITDLGTLNANNFTTASEAKAHSLDDVDLDGMAATAQAAGQDLVRALKLIAANTDAADPQLTLTNNILGTLS